MKVRLADSIKSKELLSPYDGKWYKKGTEYEVGFSLAMRMRMDGDFVVDFPYQSNPYDSSLWRDRKAFTLLSAVDPYSGWGNVGNAFVKYSPNMEIALVGSAFGVDNSVTATALHRPVEPGSAGVWHNQPKSEWLLTPFSRNIAITPFETTQIPSSWVARLNFMNAVFVPCAQNVGMMRDSGVTSPIEIIHWGVDTDKFHPIQRKTERPFTFGHMGALSIRKGTDILVEAFCAAFPKKIKDVRLICKTSNRGYPFAVPGEDRIKIQMGEVSYSDLMDRFFSEINVGVFPTRGEGWGMPLTESMATGIPIIATGWSGPMEFMDPNDGWLLDYTMEEATVFTKTVYGEECGQWAKPSFDHLVYLLRYCYEHQDEVKEKGKKAGERMLRDFTWQNKIKMFHDALARHL